MTVLNARHEQIFVPGETITRGAIEKADKADKKEGKKKEKEKEKEKEKDKKSKREKEKPVKK